MIHELGISVRKLELRVGQHYPFAGDCVLVTSLHIIAYSGGDNLSFAEKNNETLRKLLEKLVSHDAFIAPNWHPNASALYDDRWTIHLIAKFVTPASKRYFAIQIEGSIPDQILVPLRFQIPVDSGPYSLVPLAE